MNKETKTRLLSLDVFRGMTVLLMIMVNTQGSGAEPFAAMIHAEWNGCTLTDLVFPSFLFAVGNSLSFSQPGISRILRRTFLLFLVGVLLGWYPFTGPLATIRIMAVLQRIALVYCIVALAVRWLSPGPLVLLSVLLLLGYWLILYICGDAGDEYGVSGNAVRALDLQILGEKHMYRERGIVFDPEGLLSTLPAVVNVIAGYLAGILIRRKDRTTETTTMLLLAGNLLVLAGLCWDPFFPMNKKLWTSPYVLYAAGIDSIVLGVLFYIIELREWRRGVGFFTVLGKNPLFIYVFADLIGIFLVVRMPDGRVFIDWVNAVFFQRIASGALGCLLFSLAFSLVCWTVGWVLDRKKIYIRL